MARNRFVSASERSVKLLEGALLWDKAQHCPQNHPSFDAAYRAFDQWAQVWPELADEARALQRRAFDVAINL